MTFSDWIKSDTAKKLGKIAHYILMISVVAWLSFKLYDLGWKTIWTSLPRAPLFYLFMICAYFALPVAEIFVYKRSWAFPFKEAFPIFLIKKVYNTSVANYSGEVFFFAWAKKTLRLDNKELFGIIKDNNIISSVASTLVAFGLLFIFMLGGFLPIEQLFGHIDNRYYLFGIPLVLIVLLVVYRFRNTLFSLSFKEGLVLLTIYSSRFLLIQVLNVAMWKSALPHIPFYVWITFVSINLLLSRIPFLSNTNLIFMGIGMELSGALAIAESEVAGVMIAETVFSNAMNLSLYLILSAFFVGRWIPEPNQKDAISK